MKRYRVLTAAAFMALALPAAYAAQHITPEQMQERFQQMQTMMDQAQQATTPAERQKLMAEHMKTMQEKQSDAFWRNRSPGVIAILSTSTTHHSRDCRGGLRNRANPCT